MKVVGRWVQRAHIAYDGLRITAGLVHYAVTGEYSDPEGRVLRGELE